MLAAAPFKEELSASVFKNWPVWLSRLIQRCVLGLKLWDRLRSAPCVSHAHWSLPHLGLPVRFHDDRRGTDTLSAATRVMRKRYTGQVLGRCG